VTLDQPRVEQHLDVLADGRLRQRQVLRDVGAAAIARTLGGENAQDR
jgi:hypothetical protein